MSEIQLFDVHGSGWRFGVTDQGRPYAVATDVAKSFDYASAKDALRILDEDEKGRQTVPTLGGPQEMLVIFEDGIWELIFRSSKPEAKAIKKRVKAILREIQQTGRFSVIPEVRLPATYVEALRELADTVEQRDQAQARIAELEPEAARAIQTIDHGGLSLVGTVAKRFGIKVTALREFLFAERLLIRDGVRRNEPYAAFVQSGHFELKTRPVEIDPDGPPTMKSTTYVTPKGEALIWKRLFDAGYAQARELPGVQLELVTL